MDSMEEQPLCKHSPLETNHISRNTDAEPSIHNSNQFLQEDLERADHLSTNDLVTDANHATEHISQNHCPLLSSSSDKLDSPKIPSPHRGFLRNRDKSTTVEFLNQMEESDQFDLKKEIANVRRRDNRYSLFLPNPARSSFMWPLNDSLRLEDEQLKAAESLLKSVVNVVNDDNSFPDSVTPTKVDQNLVNSGYDIPYMDDAAFFCGSWYGGGDCRWSQLFLSEADLRLVHEIQNECSDKVVSRKQIPQRADPTLRHSAKLASNESLTEKAPPPTKHRRLWFALCKCTRRPRE